MVCWWKGKLEKNMHAKFYLIKNVCWVTVGVGEAKNIKGLKHSVHAKTHFNKIQAHH